MAEKLAAEIRESGGDVITMKIDHTKEEDCNEMARLTLEKYGRIDILANVAGVWPRTEGEAAHEGRWQRNRPPGGGFPSFAGSTREDWDRGIDINLNGARNCTRAVINHMMERRSGKIVNFSSIAATYDVNSGPYSAAKGAIVTFTRGLAREMESYGIQVNCITPPGTLSERMLGEIERRRQAGQEVDISRYCTPRRLPKACFSWFPMPPII